VRRKRIILVPDGMADEPRPELEGRTPLEAAHTPHMDALARGGLVGLVRTVPQGMAPGSDVANLAVLGYDPRAVYTGRAPLEAAGIGVALGPDDVAYRCNFVTIADGVMDDFTAGHIANEAARALIALLNQRLAGDLPRPAGGSVAFSPGVSYRNLMVWRGGGGGGAGAPPPPPATKTGGGGGGPPGGGGAPPPPPPTPPHDILDRPVGEYLPAGDGAAPLRGLTERAHAVLGEEGRHVGGRATDIWLWGQGRRPTIPTFRESRGLTGAAVAAADLVKGISRYAGFAVPDVPGATAYLDTDYAAKADVALAALERVDLVFVHVEAPDEAGHEGDTVEKIKAIEAIDREIVARLAGSPLKPAVLVLPDHPTPISMRTHADDPVPFVIAIAGAQGKAVQPGGRVCGSGGAGRRREPLRGEASTVPGRGARRYSEAEAAQTGLALPSGAALMDLFLSSTAG